jgi:acyl-CoA hydrolase
MSLKPKTAKETLAVSTVIVLPNDTNTIGNMMGGRLLHHLDIIAAIAAHRLCRRVVVTAAVNNVAFNYPIKLADI